VGDPVRLPLYTNPANRDDTTDRDSKIINGFAEKDVNGELWLYKRPGIDQVATLVPPGPKAVGQGVYNWLGRVFAVVASDTGSPTGANLFVDGVMIATGIDGGNGLYTFSPSLGVPPVLFFHNGVHAYTATNDFTPIVTEVTTYPSFLSSFSSMVVRGVAYLDGTFYIGEKPRGIRGSDLNNPANWDALNVILAQIEPDTLVYLTRQQSYIVVFKTWSTEFFFDAGNPVGSPLAPVPGAAFTVGCRHAGTVANNEGQVYWVGQTERGGLSVYRIAGLKHEKVSTAAIDRVLLAASYEDQDIWSYITQVAGHRFYVLTFKTSNLTLAFDITTGFWSQWTDLDGNYLPFVAAAFQSGAITLLQHETNGSLYTLSLDYLTDHGGLPIVMDIVTPNFDGGTRKKKTVNIMEFITDQNQASTLSVRHSADDYQTWSPWRLVNLNRDRPMLTKCGTFRRRAYQIRHEDPIPFRIKAVDLHMSMGSL
jgi:hypothetical protein